MWKKRSPKPQKQEFATQMARLGGFPVNLLEGLPEIELLGNKEAVVEHCQGVLEYTDEVVRLNTGKVQLKFTGSGLRLKSMTDSSVVIEGVFTSLEFIR